MIPSQMMCGMASLIMTMMVMIMVVVAMGIPVSTWCIVTTNRVVSRRTHNITQQHRRHRNRYRIPNIPTGIRITVDSVTSNQQPHNNRQYCRWQHHNRHRPRYQQCHQQYNQPRPQRFNDNTVVPATGISTTTRIPTRVLAIIRMAMMWMVIQGEMGEVLMLNDDEWCGDTEHDDVDGDSALVMMRVMMVMVVICVVRIRANMAMSMVMLMVMSSMMMTRIVMLVTTV